MHDQNCLGIVENQLSLAVSSSEMESARTTRMLKIDTNTWFLLLKFHHGVLLYSVLLNDSV